MWKISKLFGVAQVGRGWKALLGATAAEEETDLRLRAFEALALAIDAKDSLSQGHFRRLEIYAREIAIELKMREEEMQALQTAVFLHDIGKLAVPDYIVSKPGRLTPEEFQKMKVHPIIGAEILDRVRFPFPVAPIVRAHHEKWDGSGYPDGLAGDEIPLGARILAVVDCIDVLASGRQYRRALPLSDAMDILSSESGKSFDPKVIEVLNRRYLELEKRVVFARRAAEHRPSDRGQPVFDDKQKIPREPPTEAVGGNEVDFVVSIAAARDEFQHLLALMADLGSSLNSAETMALLTLRLRSMIPHDTAALFVLEGEMLVPKFVGGEEASVFSDIQIPIEQGLCGWVVANAIPILNGNPAIELRFSGKGSVSSRLRSAISIPLGGHGRVIGALTLYSTKDDFFSNDHLRLLVAIGSKVGQTIDNALMFERLVSDPEQVTSLKNGVSEWNRRRRDNPDEAVDLSGANLHATSLAGANLTKADLGWADLSETDLSGASLIEANLTSARLQSATLDGANLTDVKLWGTQRDGWSIKGVICKRAHWDRDGAEVTQYSAGEFERLYSEQPRIELFYEGGITKFELNTLPALLHRLVSLHPDCGIRLKSMEETGGGAKISISVENATPPTFQEIKSEAQRSQAAQIALRDNAVARLEIEKRLLLDEVFPRMLPGTNRRDGRQVANVNYTTHFHSSVGNVAQQSDNVNQISSALQTADLERLVAEFSSHLDELGLHNGLKQRAQAQIATIQAQLRDEPDPVIVQQAGRTLRSVTEGAIGSLLAAAIQPSVWQWVQQALARFT